MGPNVKHFCSKYYNLFFLRDFIPNLNYLHMIFSDLHIEPIHKALVFSKGFLAIRRLLSPDAKFNVICRNSAHGCCTCSLKTYSLTSSNVDRRLIFFLSFCFKGRCRLEILIINCMCYFQYYTCVNTDKAG